MRPIAVFLLFLAALLMTDVILLGHWQSRTAQHKTDATTRQVVVSALGLTDLSLATEARYTRHPAVTDMVVPFMDHPGAIEHFPSGSFWAEPISKR
ncbi:MAG: hypothetical protein KKD63_01140 [Proteobacteria bacterium]|nr:hypothetical protein [Desulfobulbaceae bacterium]MBU4151465.1 hypothetical protein [Pseudomonadota bacterium]MDP2107026.1 hypothetical protein [Desulfobulbaceae bacterium]